MNEYPNYGYPLLYIIDLMSINFLVILVIILLYFLRITSVIILFSSFITIPIIFFISLIYFKKTFNNKRKSVLNKLIHFCNIRGDEIILDLGTGAGFLAIGFAKNLINGKVYGIDKYSIKNSSFRTNIIDIIKINFIGNTIHNAKKNAKIEKVENICKFKEADFTGSLDFPNNFFDVISSSQSLYLLTPEKRKSTFKEINRILKKNGKIVFFEAKTLPFQQGWDMNYVKKYFENIGYNITIIEIPEFKKKYIFLGNKK